VCTHTRDAIACCLDQPAEEHVRMMIEVTWRLVEADRLVCLSVPFIRSFTQAVIDARPCSAMGSTSPYL